MANPIVLTNAHVTVNAVDISQYVQSVQLDVEVEDVDATAMSSSGYRTTVSGFKSGSVQLTLVNDFDVGALNATLWPLFGTTVAFTVKPVNATVTTSNPQYSGSVRVRQLAPIGGSVGGLATMQVTWPTSGAVARATT